MTIYEAKSLIAACTLPTQPQHWADLGCGNGVFSYALASLLPTGSHIVCVDKAPQRLKPGYNGVSLRFVQVDLERASFATASLSGMLMANALHYVKNQRAFIEKMKAYLSADASWIVVEYDSDVSNPWVPYPLSFESLQNLFRSAGYEAAKKLGERPSVYRRARLYACEIKRT